MASFFFLELKLITVLLLSLQFLYDLKCMVCLSKTVSGIFHFRLRFVFIKVFTSVQQKVWTLTLKRHESFQN